MTVLPPPPPQCALWEPITKETNDLKPPRQLVPAPQREPHELVSSRAGSRCQGAASNGTTQMLSTSLQESRFIPTSPSLGCGLREAQIMSTTCHPQTSIATSEEALPARLHRAGDAASSSLRVGSAASEKSCPDRGCCACCIIRRSERGEAPRRSNQKPLPCLHATTTPQRLPQQADKIRNLQETQMTARKGVWCGEEGGGG